MLHVTMLLCQSVRTHALLCSSAVLFALLLCSISVQLSQQAAGLEVQLASNSLRGPSLRVRAGNVITARSSAYVVSARLESGSCSGGRTGQLGQSVWSCAMSLQCVQRVSCIMLLQH
jgi:hypothetical protein